MKLLFGYLSKQFRGGTKYQLDFASNFEHSKVGFVTSNTQVDYEDTVKQIGPIHRIPPTRKVKERIDALKALAKEYDILYLNRATLNFVEFYIVKKAGFKKIVYHSHSVGKDCKNRIIKLMYTIMHMISRPFVAGIADKMYACSDPAGKWLFGKRNRSRVKIINNGINVEQYRFNAAVRERVREELALTGNVILHVGSFSAVKNQEYLLKAFAVLHEQLPESTLLFVGDGELLDHVKKQSAILGLNSSVRFLGYRNDVFNIMQAADLFVLPSKIEGLPFVAIEAQTAGLPCIITSVATKQTKVTDICEFYNINNAPEKLAAFMQKKLLVKRRDMADVVIEAGFDLKSCARNLEKELEEMLK